VRKLFISTLLAGAAFAAQPAQAALVYSGVPCSGSDIGIASAQCVGFYNGNLSSNSTSADQTAALALLGLVFPDAYNNAIEKISPVPAPTNVLDFATPLSGITYIGIHWGNIPNPEGGKPLANSITSFYKFDAGTSLDKLMLAFNSTSNATLYKTGTPPVVPEPATWAMMLAGFGTVGYAMRRRRNVTVSFA
jgi:hypothetical protein